MIKLKVKDAEGQGSPGFNTREEAEAYRMARKNKELKENKGLKEELKDLGYYDLEITTTPVLTDVEQTKVSYSETVAKEVANYIHKKLNTEDGRDIYEVVLEADALHLKEYGNFMYDESYWCGEPQLMSLILEQHEYGEPNSDHLSLAQIDCLNTAIEGKLKMKELKEKLKVEPSVYTKRDVTVKHSDPWYHLCVGEGFDFYVSMMGTARIEYGKDSKICSCGDRLNVIQLSKEQTKSLYRFLKRHREVLR